MASGWQETAFQQAQVASERLRQLLTAAQAHLHTKVGLDLGLQPQNYPWWVFLAVPALLGLLLFVVLIRAAGRGSAPKSRVAEEKVPVPALTVPSVQPAKSSKPEDPKKKAKKKTPEKAKPNGRPVELVQEEVITAVKRDSVKQPTEAEKKNEKNKKNKKKLKSESKSTQSNANTDKKEAEEGNWETKISNREKRQQRKRDKGADDLSEIISETFTPVSSPPAGVRKIKGSSEVSAVNGNTWNEKPAKLITAQVIEEKWVPAASSGKKKADPCTWNQEASEANGKEWSAPWSERSIFPGLTPWSAVDGRVNKSEPRPQSFSTIGLNNAIPVKAVVSEPLTHPNVCDSQWDAAPAESSVDDEWSGLNGMGSADPSSDWNAPAEVWGNYDEEEPATSQPEEPDQEASKVSDHEKGESATQNSSSGKTKKKKKKKKQGEESGSPTQDAEGVDEVVSIQVLAPEAPSQATKGIPISSGKVNEPKKTSEQKKTTSEQKKNEPKKPSDVKKTSEPKTNEQKKSEQKTSESKKASEQKTESKKASEPKKTNEHKKNIDAKKSEEETRSFTVLAESPVLNTLTEKSSSEQTQEKNASVNKQNIVPPPLQGKAEENWESPKQVKKKKKARRET